MALFNVEKITGYLPVIIKIVLVNNSKYNNYSYSLHSFIQLLQRKFVSRRMLFIHNWLLTILIQNLLCNNYSLYIFTFSSWMRRYWFYVKNDFRNFYQIFTFWDPLSQKEGFLRKCLSVCLSVGRVRHNSRQNYQIELSFGTLYRSRKSKDKFDNQPHPIKIEGLSTAFVFLKITFWKNQIFQYWFLIVLINLYKLSW